MVLANPGPEPAEVTLRYLSTEAQELTITVPSEATVQVPQAFLLVQPETGVWAQAISGTFVIAAVSFSLGPEGRSRYAVSLGIPVPDAAV
jgi:hypothetical protein